MSEASADLDRVRAVVDAHRALRGALLPILHEIQAEFGHVDAAAVPVVAEGLNLSQAEVAAVLAFYRDFRTTAPGRHRIRICRAEACLARGADALLDHVRARLSLDLDQTGADGRFTLEPVWCLGNCALGPSVEIDGRLHGRVDAARFDEVMP